MIMLRAAVRPRQTGMERAAAGPARSRGAPIESGMPQCRAKLPAPGLHRIAAIREWAYANMDDIEAARSDFDALRRDRS